MANYQYKARDKFGKLMQGIRGADSEKAVILKLEEMGYMPIAITQRKAAAQLNKIFDRFKSVKFSDLNMLTRLLCTLQKAGLPLLSGLKAIEEQTTNQILKNIVKQIARDIEGGENLSSALGRHPQVFNPLYVNMIKSGEISGRLVEVLERLATLGEHEERTRLRIKAAMRYPIIVVAAIIIGFLLLITLVVPRFEAIYSKFTTDLPLPTQLLLGLNYAVTKYWWVSIIVIGAFIYLGFKLVSTKKGMFWWDVLKLNVPVFGPLTLKLIMSRFCRVTGTLLRSGVPILQILELVSGSVGNVVISNTINNIKMNVNEGKGMYQPMKTSGMFPPIVLQMVAAGEETGKLDELLLHVSDYYDSQIDYTIGNLVSLIEPILIFILGCAVLFLALGIFMPMWSLMKLFK